MSRLIKICGVRDKAGIDAAGRAGASHIGFVFHPKSPRYIKAFDAARLGEAGLSGMAIVALVGDADDQALADIIARLDPAIIQFHGSESAARLGAFKAMFPDIEIWKALPVASIEDIEAADSFAGIADRLVFDAAPPAGADRGGGHGAAFNWSLLANYAGPTSWLLSGGLTPGTVAAAIAVVKGYPGFTGVDVSSGVECQPGQKDPARITRFIEAARGAMDG